MEDVPEMIRFVEGVVSRGEPYLVISDTRRAPSSNAKARKLMSEESKRVEQRAGHLDMGAVVVLESAAVRAAVTAVMFFFRPKAPLKLVGTAQEAAAVAKKMLEERGLLTPAAERKLEAFAQT